MKNFVVRSAFFILISSFVVSCLNHTYDFGENGSVVIEYGTVCGWCAGEEAITVSSVKVDYLRQIPCGDNKGTKNATNPISEERWNDIITSFDYSHFVALDYNECNVCADGCDEFIKITKNGSTHEIRYSPSIQIDGLDDLRDELNSLINDFSSE